jgi:hypothetical protein
LGNVTDLRTSAPLTGSGKGYDTVIILLAQNRFEQGAFAGTVGANQRSHLAAMGMKANILQDPVMTDLNRKIFNSETAGVTAGTSMGKNSHPSASLIVLILWYMASK